MSTTPCCINGFRRPIWVLDPASSRMVQRVAASCGCDAGKQARDRAVQRLGVEPGNLEAMLAAIRKDQAAADLALHAEDAEALAAWREFDDRAAKAAAAEREAARLKIWAPRYAAGLMECTRCGGTGHVPPYGTCFRCHGNGIDPKRKKGAKR